MSGARSLRWLAWTLLSALTICLALPRAAHAQGSAPQLETSASARDVEIGEAFTIQLSAMVNVSDRMPTSPELRPPHGVIVRSGPTVMPKTHVTINGPNLIQQMGIVASWTLEGRSPGRYRIGPPSVMFGGRRFQGNAVRIEVHRPGTLPSRRQPRSNDPFDMFDIFGLPKPPGLFGHDAPLLGQPYEPPNDPGLAMTYAPSPTVFLRAQVDKNHVVLGEQVTLSIYQYFQAVSLKPIEAREPSVADFLQHSILNPTDDTTMKYAEVGSTTWRVRLIRKLALFPLRIGDLTVGPMQITYQGRGLRSATARSTQPIPVRVDQAPEGGRPAGFRPGDVGSFSLSASVEPRKVEAGGAVAVVVKLVGSGNMPSSLETPARKGVEWLDPQIDEDIDVDDGRLRGTRTFTYIVRLEEAGNIDLGQLKLPYWDPDRKRYQVAVATLGSVAVTPSTKMSDGSPAAVDRFNDVPGVRTALGAVRAPGRPITDFSPFWLALAAGPLSVMVLGVGARVARSTRARFASWRTSLERASAQALKEAKKSYAEGDRAKAAASSERAVHAAVEAATGVKSRGLLREDIIETLLEQGAAEPTAQMVVDVLAACEAARFDPNMDEERVGELIERAGKLVQLLSREAKKSG